MDHKIHSCINFPKKWKFNQHTHTYTHHITSTTPSTHQSNGKNILNCIHIASNVNKKIIINPFGKQTEHKKRNRTYNIPSSIIGTGNRYIRKFECIFDRY